MLWDEEENMSAIQAQIDELQKQLVMQQMAEAEREQKKQNC